MRHLLTLIIATLVAVSAPRAQNPLDGMSVEELEQLLEQYDQQIEQLEQRERDYDADLEIIDGMIEDIDRTLEDNAPYTAFEPIPLLGVDEPAAPPQAPITVPVGLPSDPMGFNSWCFNTLSNFGVRHGFPDTHSRDLAGFAMADASQRILRLSTDAGYDAAMRETYDKAMFDNTIAVAERLATGTASAEETALYDACRAKGVRGVRYAELHVAPVEGLHDKIWCASTLAIFNQRQMIGGGPERVARAQRALEALDTWLGHEFKYIAIADADRDVLENGYYFRSLVQVDAFQFSQGDKGSFEQDYEICFPMEELTPPVFRIDIPAFPPQRPAQIASGWDYPLSFDFRFNAWCYGAMHQVAEGSVAGTTVAPDDAEAMIGTIHDLLSAEGTTLGLSAEQVAEMEVEAYHDAAFEFSWPVEEGAERPLTYGYGFCTNIGVDFTSMFGDVAPDLRATAEAEFDDAVWCLAGLERVLGSETRREYRSALEEGMQSLGNIAARHGLDLGLNGEEMLARLAAMKPQVDAEIRTRRRPDGMLMIAHCLDRGVGYHEEFYNWVDPE
ncbi:MAG: hypothetical protein KIT02_07330 [Devosia sp.]|uniref:hypothetical protein n=1 Tax=Devosia sp. TaxID=1871048 RepID=UPI0024C7170F|nr:hypothetical protein [Devosia sp.]UYO01005.1 MAG: hypothetical protein KIT02_07330 [Devosia sp.]